MLERPAPWYRILKIALPQEGRTLEIWIRDVVLQPGVRPKVKGVKSAMKSRILDLETPDQKKFGPPKFQNFAKNYMQ